MGITRNEGAINGMVGVESAKVHPQRQPDRRGKRTIRSSGPCPRCCSARHRARHSRRATPRPSERPRSAKRIDQTWASSRL